MKLKLIPALLALTLTLTTCGKGTEDIIEQAPPVQTNVPDVLSDAEESRYDAERELTETETKIPETTFPETTSSETAAPQQAAGNTPSRIADGEIVYDIELNLSEREILIGRDDPEVVVCAVPEPDCSPASIQLYDADSGEFLCDLVDDCDYEAHGDNIQGDGWYCNRYTIPTDFGVQPDVSEDHTYRFIATFQENGIVHHSQTFEVLVMEPWTDKETDERESVYDSLDTLMELPSWQQADTAEREKLVLAMLEDFASRGIIIPESIYSDGDFISFAFTSGGSSGIKLTPFDPMLN